MSEGTDDGTPAATVVLVDLFHGARSGRDRAHLHGSKLRDLREAVEIWAESEAEETHEIRQLCFSPGN